MKPDRREQQKSMDAGKNTVKHASNYRKTYLFLYNLMMFVMFLMVNLIALIKGLTGSMDDDSVRGAAFIIKILTYTQLLETVHPILGLVPGGPMMPFLQVIGRLLVNHFLTDPTIRMNSAPYAHYLFIVWSSIEIFRYSFYALRVFNVDIYPLTWCRYTLFMPLYPMGGFCEAQIVLATAKEYEKSGAFSIELPNASNFSFSMPTFLRAYAFVLLAPSIMYLMRYMWSQRCKQLKVKLS
jgi:very-long-chain (3R)-3-hydroxyacyl-CoA dehydratase